MGGKQSSLAAARRKVTSSETDRICGGSLNKLLPQCYLDSIFSARKRLYRASFL
jgi:hypothetical protein